MPVVDGRSGTYSAVPSVYGATQTSNWVADVLPETSKPRIVSQPTVPTITDDVSALGGLSARWRADQITGLANGDIVIGWPDASGYGYTASNVNAGTQPTWRSAAVGGQPAVRFDGTDDYLSSFAPAGSPQTTVIVVMRTSGSGIRTICSSSIGGGFELRVEANEELRIVKMGVVDIGHSSTFVPLATDTSGTVTYDTASGDFAFQIGGVAAGTGNNAQTLDPAATVWIGKNPAFGVPFAGDIAELIVFARVLTSTDLATVQTYISARYPEVHTTSGTATGTGSASASTTTTRTKAATATVTASATGSASSVRTKTATASATATATGAAASVRTKTGTAAATASANAATATVRPKTGTAQAAATASRTGTSVRVKTGTATATASASATTSHVEGHTTFGTATATASATATETTTRTTTRTATATASGTRVGASVRTTIGAAVAITSASASTATARPKSGVATLAAGSTALTTTWRTGTGTATAYATADGLTAQSPAGRDITLTVGPGRSRSLTATGGTSRGLTAVGTSTRNLDATGASRQLAAVGRSRTLTIDPLE